MMQIPLGHILVLSSLLFSIGVLGVLLRRNAIVIFMSIELMLNAVNLSFVGFAQSMDCSCRSSGWPLHYSVSLPFTQNAQH